MDDLSARSNEFGQPLVYPEETSDGVGGTGLASVVEVVQLEAPTDILSARSNKLGQPRISPVETSESSAITPLICPMSGKKA